MSRAAVPQEFHYDAATADVAAHWAGRATLAHALMFGGMGERLAVSMPMRDDLLRHAGYVVRPAMVGALYNAADPAFPADPSYDRPETLVWQEESFDRTLVPAVQAWALIKITSPAFRLAFHERREDRLVGLMMLPQAQAQLETLRRGLLTPHGWFASRQEDGRFAGCGPAIRPWRCGASPA